MNRRLFVRHVAAGLALPLLPSVLSTAVGGAIRDQGTRNASVLFAGDQLGRPQHITISHVYSPERTSVAALKGLVEADFARINAQLGVDFALTDQVWSELASSAFGSYSIQSEKDGVKLTWQGLARIGGEAGRPTTCLTVYGSRGVLQANPAGNGYQAVDWQGQVLSSGHQLGRPTKLLNRRSVLMA